MLGFRLVRADHHPVALDLHDPDLIACIHEIPLRDNIVEFLCKFHLASRPQGRLNSPYLAHLQKLDIYPLARGGSEAGDVEWPSLSFRRREHQPGQQRDLSQEACQEYRETHETNS